MKQILLLFILLATVSIKAQEETPETPRIMTRIALGQSVNFDGVMVQFAEVLEDSRCPSSVTCVWEGRARVKVLVTEEGQETVEKKVIFGRVLSDESTEPVLCERTEFKLKAVQLVPFPQKPGERLKYYLLVDKLPND